MRSLGDFRDGELTNLTCLGVGVFLGVFLRIERGRPRRGGSAAGVVGVMKAGLRRWMEMVSARDPMWSVKWEGCRSIL